MRELAEEMGIGKQVVLNKMNADPLRYLLSSLENGMERGPRNIIYLSEEAEALVRRAFTKSDTSKTSYNKIRQVNTANRVSTDNINQVDSLVSEVNSMVSEFGFAVSNIGSAASELNSTTSELRSAASELNSATSEVKSVASELNYATSEVRSVATMANSMTPTASFVIPEDNRKTLRADFAPLINKPTPSPESPFKVSNPVIMQTEPAPQPLQQLDEPAVLQPSIADTTFEVPQIESASPNNEITARYIDELNKQIDFLKSEMIVKDSQLKAKDDQLKAKDIQISAKDEQIKEFQGYIKSVIENANTQQSATLNSLKAFSNTKVQQPNINSEVKEILSSAEKKPSASKKRSIFDANLPEATQQRINILPISQIERPQFNNLNADIQTPTIATEALPKPTTSNDDDISTYLSTENEVHSPSFDNPITPPLTPVVTESPLPITKQSILDMPLREMEYTESDSDSATPVSNVYNINTEKSIPMPASGTGFEKSFNFEDFIQPANQEQNFKENLEEIQEDINEQPPQIPDETPAYYANQPTGFFSKFLKR